MFTSQSSKILVLAPHTDDGELGCGGTIVKMLREGHQVFYVAFSTADDSVPEGFPKNQLELEVKQATGILGIPEENLIIYYYAVRKLNYVRQEVLEALIKLRDTIRPELVILPSSKDVHQDHLTVYHEGVRAFKFCSMLGYELIWNNLGFETDCFIEIDKEDLHGKMRALDAYVTQRGKNYMNPDFIRSLAVVRGTQIGVPFAEAFEVIRWIVR
ncbi:MAG TPA: PIG-L deacetylase family protein [Saprospiraceae bacterium]|nr:PIG-L deacetylase family protein [Saprospiraceae bacterium]